MSMSSTKRKELMRKASRLTKTGRAKRLYLHKSYRLKDGREFLYFAKYDPHTAMGKIIVGRNGDDYELANMLVSLAELRECEQISSTFKIEQPMVVVGPATFDGKHWV